MRRPARLRTRLLAWLLPTVLLALGALAADAHRTSRSLLWAEIVREAQGLGARQALELDRHLEATWKAVEGLAVRVGEASRFEARGLEAELSATLRANPDVLGMALAFEPGATPLGPYAAYLHREGQALRLRSLAGPDYDYRAWDWFRRPLARGVGGWGDPYLDPAVRQLMVTCSVPIRCGGRLVGVATGDLALGRLEGILASGPGERAFSAYLLSAEGLLVAATAHGGATAPRARELAQLQSLVRRPGVDVEECADPLTGRPSWILEQPLPGLVAGERRTAWSLILSLPTEELLAPLRGLTLRLAAGAALAVVALVLLVRAIATSVLHPVRDLAELAGRYAAGAFDQPIPEARGARELQELAATFNALGREVVLRMEEERASTAQKERYRQELAIAAELQQAILPRTFPPFPDLADRVDLHGLMRPAREVGGDFFDFVPLPGGRLGVMVGDVSGKGAPAALFMTQARLLVRLLASQGLEPAEIFDRANRILVDQAPEPLFVTLVYVDYDPSRGEFTVTSAGHPSPIKCGTAEAPVEIRHPRALPLGAWADTRYAPVVGTLPPGGRLVLYSDGLSEAMDGEGSEFGLARILAALAGEGLSSRETNALLEQARADFMGTTAASDDLTLVTLRRTPPADA